MNDLSFYILDIVQNSIKANCNIVNVKINEDEEHQQLFIIIEDDGCGMDEETIKQLINPYFTSRKNRDVGLGIPMLLELCDMCDGSLEITSEINKGTKIEIQLKLDNYDLPELGNLEESIISIILNDREVDLIFEYIKGEKIFYISTIEIKKILGEISIIQPDVIIWLKEYIKEKFNLLNFNRRI